MSTSKTYQQSLADAGYENRPPMLEMSSYIPWAIRLAKQLTVDLFDDLFDYLQQFEKLFNATRAKKLEKSHNPLALDDVYHNSKDPLVSAMLLHAKAITQNFSNPTNNHLRASSNTKNQAIIQGDRVNIQIRNSGNTRRNSRRAYGQKEVVKGTNAPKETRNDEAGVILTDEQNDFLFADCFKDQGFMTRSISWSKCCWQNRMKLA
ncbi:hypothetical protein Tco_0828260 [Tanacetum coccineum]